MPNGESSADVGWIARRLAEAAEGGDAEAQVKLGDEARIL
jgi:hypothetical protein